MCFWNEVFASYDSREAQKNVIKVSVPLPDYSKGDKIADYVGGLFAASIWTCVPNQTFKLSLKNSRIVQKDGRSIALTFLNGTYNITPKDPEDNGFFSYTLKFDKSKLPKPSENLNGARFETTITVIDASFRSQKAKVDYFYALDRFKMDRKKLTDVFLKQGVNVICLPVTWTPFVDDKTFKIDEAWLKAVQSEVDYILSKGAYCILNMQMDYLQHGVPCLWWEDFFYAEDNSQYWLYNKETSKWGRPQIVSTIKIAVGVDGAKQ